MKIMKPVETMSIDDLTKFVENFITAAFSLGFLGGISLFILSVSKEVSKSQKGFIAAIAAITILLLILFMDRHIRRKVMPEIRNRCHRD